LMRRQGLQGVMRGKVVRTTISDSKALCPLDKVNRQFKANRPNQLCAYFSPSWTAFQADRGRDFSVMVDGVSN